MVAFGERLTAAGLFAALEAYDAVTRTVGEFLEPYDVLVTPTCPRLPDRLGTYFPGRDGIDADRVFADLEPKETFTALFNGTGSPALSVPFAISEGGLPIGLQLVANFGRDDLLLALAAAIEAEVRWHDRRPPVHVGSPE